MVVLQGDNRWQKRRRTGRFFLCKQEYDLQFITTPVSTKRIELSMCCWPVNCCCRLLLQQQTAVSAKLPWNYSRWQPLMQRRTTDLWLQSPPFTPSLQTTCCCPQLRCNARSYKHTFPLPDAHSLFYMPINLRLEPLRFSSLLGITLHNNCIKRLYNCSTKSLAQRRDLTTGPTATRTKQKNTKTNYSECCPIFISSPSNRHHFPPNLPAVFFLASCTSSPCTVTILTSQNHKPRRPH